MIRALGVVVAGAVLVVGGLWLLSPAVALIVAGLLVAAAGLTMVDVDR